MPTRRQFVTALGAAAVGASGANQRSHSPLPTPLFGGMRASRDLTAAARIRPIGVQLYTVRGLMQRDLDGTLAQVARIGFTEVEFAGYFNRTPEQVRAILGRNRLAGPSAHIPIELLETDWPRTLANAQIMGHRYLVVAWTPQERRRTLDDWRRIGDLFSHTGEAASREGITFAYHNHDYEFVPLEGQVPFDVLLETSDPAHVKVEMDLYWIRKGGKDPLAYFERWPGRFPMVHVKDMTADGRMVDVGAGAIDWRAIFARRGQAGIRHYFVEHDDPPDPMASIAVSYRYLSRLRV
ncbi:MAG: sugar phosphate isomerase/epimerase [Gemmatimonadetes bacterium]|nr:sugar phosphate isomerase/epimerase [Gemmatimonadota bacterium]